MPLGFLYSKRKSRLKEYSPESGLFLCKLLPVRSGQIGFSESYDAHYKKKHPSQKENYPGRRIFPERAEACEEDKSDNGSVKQDYYSDKRVADIFRYPAAFARLGNALKYKLRDKFKNKFHKRTAGFPSA